MITIKVAIYVLYVMGNPIAHGSFESCMNSLAILKHKYPETEMECRRHIEKLGVEI